MPSERIQRQIDALLDEADAAIKQSDWALVRDRAENALRLDPENADAQAYLAAAQRPGSGDWGLGVGGAGAVLPQSPTPSTQPPAPTAFCDGRYQVVRFLGEGGKKRVFLAHDSKLDRDVAFALIKTDGLDDEGLLRIKREAQAMGRLGDHPHIVSVFDIGDESGQPYLVSQLMPGGDVEGLIEKAAGHRLPLDVALKIGDQVCQALEHAHSQGIVHRDLKPGNVWLTADGTAKIGDFGLALSLDRSRLTQAGMMVGTVSYMPPEQALGGEVTPRSDLYSLGAVLYELTTGRPPFVGDESVAIITQHLNTPPIAPSWHVPDLPPGLEALILRLLEKDPAKRPASAGEVRGMLAAGTRGPTPTPPPTLGEGLDAGGDSPLPKLGEEQGVRAFSNPLYRRTFVGREQELRQLQGAFDGAISGQGALVMVVGEPGIGKTALCEQLATYVAMRGGKSLVGHCYEEGSLSLPYLPFVEALRSYVLGCEPDALRQELGSGAADVARIISEIRDRVGLAPTPSPQTPAPALDPDDDRWRLLQAVTTFLRNAAAVQPMVLILEDLHWADRGTLDLLLHVARSFQGARLLVVGTYRDVDVDRAHPLSAALAELRRLGEFARVPLRGLTPDEVHRMVNAITGQGVRWSLAEAVHRQTEGNPLFIQEVLRYLVEEGLIHREDGRWRRAGDAPPEMSIPEGLRDVVGRRLSRLTPECNALLSIAAVVGREFSPETLEAVAGASEAQLLSGLEEARRIGVLEELTRPGQVRYRFAHAFFRQVLYEELIAPRRIRLHQQVARATEVQHARRIEEHAAELAEHFSHSSDVDDLAKAVRYGEMAARRAMAVNAYGEAARHLERALQVQEVLDPDHLAQRCDLTLRLAEALGPAGEPQRVFESAAEDAFSLAEAIADSGRAAHAADLAVDALTRYGAARGRGTPLYHLWVERLAANAAPGTAARIRADSGLADQHFRAGQWSEARTLARGLFDGARQIGDPDALFRAAWLRVSPQWAPCDWLELPALTRELAAYDRTQVSRHALAQFLLGAPYALLVDGDRKGAEELWREQEALAAHTQDAELLLQSFWPEGNRLLLEGHLESIAGDFTDRVTARGDELGSPVAGASTASYFAFLSRLYLGRASEALAHVGDRGGSMRAGDRALCLAHMGRTEEAQSELARILGGMEISDATSARLLAYLLETAVLVGDIQTSERLAHLLGDVVAVYPPISAVARIVGDAAVLRGDPAARGHYERALEWATRIRFRPEIALTRLAMAELVLDEAISAPPTPDSSAALKAEALAHLDFAIDEFRAMKMQPSLERALRHKGLLRA